MRIKNQFLITIVTFSIILIIIGTSIALTQQQIAEFNNQEALAHDIQTGASDLNYISNNYFLYQDNSSVGLWQVKFSSLCSELAQLNSTNSKQQAMVNTVNSDLEHLNTIFAGVTTFLNNAPRNVSIRVLPSFQTQWNRMSVQIQALAFDSQQLSQSIRDQTNQAILTNTILTIAFLGLFGAFFIASYLITYQRTLRSISKLQDGIGVIGSGNLDYTIDASKKDEIADISKSINQMTTNLKIVTASKTELEKVQASLLESEQRWATTLASIGDAVIATDTSGKIMFMNNEAEELTGWALSETITKPVKIVFNIINEQTRLEVESPIDRVLREGMVVGLANHTVLIQKDGTEVPIDDSGAPIRNKDGKITGVVLVFRDITERKKAQDALSRANEELEEKVRKRTEQVSNERQRLYNVLETLPAYVVLLDKDYRVPFANKVFRERFGESHGRRCYDFLFNRNSACENCETYKVLKINGPHHWEWIGPDGHDYDVYDFPFADADGSNLILEMGIDITERKKAEAMAQESARKLKDSERLAAIGATAGMVGHDIRNPLQAITGDVYLTKQDVATLPESETKQSMQENLAAIEQNVDYINKIVQDLQDFARPLNPRAEETDLKRVIDDLLAKNGLPNNIEVSVNVETEKVVADPTFINRIMYNLVINAVQAMPKGGKLTINAYKQSNDIVITVKDTGVGIPEAVKGKMFTPMFTTKSKGQGFGLAVIKRMTEALGGTVTFESLEDKGTTFTVRFPPPKS